MPGTQTMKQTAVEQTIISVSGKVAGAGGLTAAGSGAAGKIVQSVSENPNLAAQAVEWSTIGVISGIVVGVIGLIVQIAFHWRRDRRETRVYEARIEAIRGGYER